MLLSILGKHAQGQRAVLQVGLHCNRLVHGYRVAVLIELGVTFVTL